jgi:ribonuclease PH
MVDLCYEEDSRAEVDMNLVMTDRGLFVEVQGTAEGQPFSQAQLEQLLSMGWAAIQQLLDAQRAALA